MTQTILHRLFGRFFRAGPPDGPPALELEEQMLDAVRRDVAAGFNSRAEMIESIREAFDGEVDPTHLTALAQTMVDNALRVHDLAQLSWSPITDYDRLEAAFAALEAEGVIARQNFSCCGTCGADEIWDEVKAAQGPEGATVQGYTFFHQQDTEAAVDCGTLYLAYGATANQGAAAIAVGNRIVSVFEASGLSADWNGSLNTRILVTLDWKRRRTDLGDRTNAAG